VTAWTWFKLVRNSILAAALITAAQVGIGSGVGVLDWGHGLVDAGAWRDLLTWVVFVFAIGVLGGAAVGQRFFPGRVAATTGNPNGGRLGGLRPSQRFWLRVTAAVSAGLGAVAAFPLVWLPVLVARPTMDLQPQATIGLTAGAGIVIGLLLSIAALAWGAAAAGSALSAAWVWLLALTSAALGAVNHTPINPDLGVLDAPQVIPATAWWFGPYFMVGLAAMLGLAVAATAGWRGATWPGIALSGVVGPVLVAATYAITGWILPATGLTVIRGDTSAVRAASLVAVAVGALVSVCVAVPQVSRHRLPDVVALPPRRPTRPVAIEAPRPLAISASPEAAYAPYVLEHTGREAPYRREPAYYTDPVYLEPATGYPAPPEPPRIASPVSAYSADPYSSDAFTVSAQAFDADVFSTPPAPVYHPTPRSAPVPSAPVSSAPVSSGPVATAVPSPVSSPAPAPAQPARPEPVATRAVASYVAPSRLVEEGYAKPASPTEPGHEERVYRGPAQSATPAAAATPGSKRRDRKAARAAKAAPVVKKAPAAKNAPAASTPSAPVSPLRAGSIEGEIISGSTSPAGASTGPSTPTSPASGTTPATPTGPGRTPQGGRRARKPEDKPLRKGERDHIDWISNLVSIEADAELKTSKER
jgi:hypothetical protein